MNPTDPQEPGTGTEPQAESGANAAEARIAEAEARAQQHREDLLRAAAEMDNVRKRAAREIDAARQYGIERFAGELLPVADSLVLGLESAPGADPATLREGQDATLRLLLKAFERAGLTEIDSAGQPFDPGLHEAMAMGPSAEQPPHTVLQVVQRGWLLNGRLLRPARVIVSTAPAGEPADPDPAGG
jgi:molecular chaperone GrpE